MKPRRPIKRVAIKKRVTPRRIKVKQQTDAALAYYFHATPEGSFVEPCQICGAGLVRPLADPAHLFRRWHGKHEPQHIAAAHRLCHSWLDRKKEREDFARESGVSCLTGGVIQWPTEMRKSLDEWLTKGVDRINLKGTK